MKYRHISARSQQFVVPMLVINHLGFQSACLIPTHQNSKPVVNELIYNGNSYFIS